MRKFLIAGNWKMHGDLQLVESLLNGIKQKTNHCEDIDILVLPTLLHIYKAHKYLNDSRTKLGAQNFFYENKGAFTGEVSAVMLKELNCQYALVGHSERRALFQETDETVARKFKAAIDAGIKPVLCIGETQKEREENQTFACIKKQLHAVLAANPIDAFKQAVIAYEPVWAIGTGLTASPEHAQEVHLFIRNLLAKENLSIANELNILYGGSLKPENAEALLSMPDIDGGLIGGASLDATSFASICTTAQKISSHKK